MEDQIILGDADLKAENIKAGVNIFGVTGTMKGLYNDSIQVGDYVSYTPEKTSYDISKSLTGYDSVQNINPSELNLWRVIRKNDDGSIDLVSVYTSSKEVFFNGKKGYKNYIGALNEIAESYETEGITSGSRYMGYDGQTEFITDESKLDLLSPWTENTNASNSPKGSEREHQGGGDVLYTTDTNLVNAVFGTLKAYIVNTIRVPYYYLLASRDFKYLNCDGEWCPEWYCQLRMVDKNGDFFMTDPYFMSDSIDNDEDREGYLRPIVTLKSGIQAISGNGESAETAWKIN